MRYSELLIPTLREDPTEAEVISQKFLVRGGFIRKLASGIYSYLPLFVRVIKKVEAIIREEMNSINAQEVFMPSVIPAELWQESGRWNIYGKELLRFKDRKDHDYIYGPTHEEVIVDMVRSNVKSYKQLPLHFYQIQTKFRDEIRPRFGLMRCREFTMKDAYSFHSNQNCLETTYQKVYSAYSKIFERCGLKFRVVNADSGNIGGAKSQEFMILAETGEDEILYCSTCQHAANIEKAEAPKLINTGDNAPLKKVNTPNIRSINELTTFFQTSPTTMIKSLVYRADEQFVLACVRGDFDVNETKLKRILNADILHLAHENEVQELLGAPIGFAGPLDLPKTITIIADESLRGLKNAISGANELDSHFTGMSIERDLKWTKFEDIRLAKPGEHCPVCQKGTYQSERGIEVGHIFELGTKYSEAMNALFLDEQGNEHPYIMGCYGIGVGRTIAAAIEQNHDAKGIIWPTAIAPFDILLLAANPKDDIQVTKTIELYAQLCNAGFDVLWDDRDERFGVKMNDAELIGIPIRVVVGRGISEQKVEVSTRKTLQREEISIEGLITHLKGVQL